MTTEIIPLRVRVSDGSAAPEPLTTKRTAATREEILAGLTVKERMLIYAIVEALESLAADWQGEPMPPAADALLRAFQDATGVSYVGCAWDDEAG